MARSPSRREPRPKSSRRRTRRTTAADRQPRSRGPAPQAGTEPATPEAPAEPVVRKPKASPQAFTVKHFRAWARNLELDNGNQWDTEDFQEAFVGDLFSGVPECWLIIPEGNAKTTLFAGLALYHIEHRRSAMVPVGASARDQAQIMYQQGEGFIGRSELRGFRLHPGYRRIRFEAMLSMIQFQAADDRTGDGVIPTLALVDELHRHRDLRLYRTWRGKLEKRGGQLAAISTRGEPGSEFELTLERIRHEATDLSVDGTFTRAASSRLVLHEWAVPEDGDVEDIDLVKAANPLKAITVPMLREKRAAPTTTLGHWRRFVCNLPTRADESAITEAEWYAAKTDERIPEGEPIWVGLDVAWKWDTTAAVPFWMHDDKRLLGPASVLTPPRDGNSLDPDLVEKALLDIHARNPIHTVVMDTSRAEQLGRWIETDIGAIVIDRQQTNTAAVQDYDYFMEGLRTGVLKHSGDPALTRHALNAIARVLPFGDARFDRPNQSRLGPEQERRVIDALTAAAMVHATALTVPEQVEEPQAAWG
jgi:phage terminase large subunit-like protein